MGDLLRTQAQEAASQISLVDLIEEVREHSGYKGFLQQKTVIRTSNGSESVSRSVVSDSLRSHEL